MLTLIVFLIVLSILVFAHEFGHFLMAKKMGVKVEEFGFGFPPRLWKKKIGETVYSLNALPFGGFVKLFGEELWESKRVKERERKNAFWAKSKKARAVVICAGVLANFLLAIAVFSIVYSVAGIPTKTSQVRIVGIAPGSPADKIGFKEGDIVFSVDNQQLSGLNHFTKLIDEKKGNQVKIRVKREEDNPCLEKVLGGGPVLQPAEEVEFGFSCQNGQLIFPVTPRENPPEGQGSLGVIISNMEMKKFPFWQMPFRGAVEGFKEAFAWTRLVVEGLGKMIADLMTQGVIPKDIAGPLGIFQITGGVAKSGSLAVLQFIGVLSVNLAVINILPFPPFDGARLVLVLYEAVVRKRPNPGFEHWVNAIGLAFLVLLLILVTINDVNRIIETTNLLSRFRTIWSLWPF